MIPYDRRLAARRSIRALHGSPNELTPGGFASLVRKDFLPDRRSEQAASHLAIRLARRGSCPVKWCKNDYRAIRDAQLAAASVGTTSSSSMTAVWAALSDSTLR